MYVFILSLSPPVMSHCSHNLTPAPPSLGSADLNHGRESETAGGSLNRNSIKKKKKKIEEKRVLDDGRSLVDTIKLCGKLKDLHKGTNTHAEALFKGLLHNDIYITNALISMYAKFGMFFEAKKLFNELPLRDVVTWNSLMSGYTHHGHGEEALDCFNCMQEEGLSADAFTFSCILKACGLVRSLEMGKVVHFEVKKRGLLEKNLVLGNALMDMYGKCGSLLDAQEVFDKLPEPDIISWNVLISLYVQDGLNLNALDCFARMQVGGFHPDDFTFTCILKACGNIGLLKKGEEIHSEIGIRQGDFLKKNIVLGNALLDMYVKCGSLKKAKQVFDEIPARNLTSWTTLITGFAQHGLGDNALKCFLCMQEEGLSPNEVTFASTLKACGVSGSAEKGEEIHARMNKQGLLERNPILSTALVDMYAKCGMLKEAREVFDDLLVRDVVSWNALLAGYAQLGNIEKIFELYNSMLQDGIRPNRVTFLVLLTLCSHAGLISEGQMYFDTMDTVYHIAPTLEHYACMVDLFGRAGHFDKALVVIEKLTPSDRLQLWMALLGACWKWVNVELGRQAFESVLLINEKLAPVYICMRNIYVAAGMHAKAREIEDLRVKNGAWDVSSVGIWDTFQELDEKVFIPCYD